MRNIRVGFVASLAALAWVGIGATPSRTGATPRGRIVPAATSRSLRRPSIILITTDDQNLGDLRWMPETRRLLGQHGVTFTRATSPDPLCCPARAELVTGQLGQNNGVRFNDGPRGGFSALLDKGNTLPSWLEAAGYHTAFVGKYLNGYSRSDGRQPGWTVWKPIVANVYTYLGTKFYNVPGRFHRNVSSVISDLTVRYLRRFAASDKPFFIWVSHLAPHERAQRHRRSPPLPTLGHRDDLTDVVLPSLRKPSFNAVGPRPRPVRPGPRRSRADLQHWFTRRIQSLLDVDDAVRRIVRVLRRTGRLDNTYIVLTSDNGMLLGEHRLRGKGVLYREPLAVPMVVRVPGASGPRRSGALVNLTDVAPTITDLAGATAGRQPDGRSFAPILHGRHVRWRDTELIQTGTRSGAWALRGVRTRRYSYFYRVRDHTAFLYDDRRYPSELRDLAHVRSYRRTARVLRHRTSLLEHCAGRSCNRVFGAVPGPNG